MCKSHMSAHKFQFGQGQGGAALAIKVVPRASKNEIVSFMSDDSLKVRVTAPPVEGAANDAVIKLLSDALNIPKNRVMIVAGEAHSQKVVSVMGLTAEQIDDKLKGFKVDKKRSTDEED